jgi:hypothetical protein
LREHFCTCVNQNPAAPRNVRRHSSANDFSFFSPVFCTKTGRTGSLVEE